MKAVARTQRIATYRWRYREIKIKREMRIDTDMEIQIQRVVEIAINRYKDMDIERNIYIDEIYRHISGNKDR